MGEPHQVKPSAPVKSHPSSNLSKGQSSPLTRLASIEIEPNCAERASSLTLQLHMLLLRPGVGEEGDSTSPRGLPQAQIFRLALDVPR